MHGHMNAKYQDVVSNLAKTALFNNVLNSLLANHAIVWSSMRSGTDSIVKYTALHNPFLFLQMKGRRHFWTRGCMGLWAFERSDGGEMKFHSLQGVMMLCAGLVDLKVVCPRHKIVS